MERTPCTEKKFEFYKNILFSDLTEECHYHIVFFLLLV